MITKPKVQKIRTQKWLNDIQGGTSTINTLDKLAEPIAAAITSSVQFKPGEEALLGSGRTNAEWCLLTTDRLIWFQSEMVQAIPWNEIVGAQQPPQQSAEIIRGELQEDQLSILEIFEASGKKHILRLNPSPEYYIIWSAILAFCRYSRRPDPIPLK